MTKASVRPGLERIEQKLEKINTSMNVLRSEITNSMKGTSNRSQPCGCDGNNSKNESQEQKDDVVDGNKENEKTS